MAVKKQTQEEQETKELNLYQKLAIIGERVKVLKKSKKGYGYNYTPDEEILALIQGGMKEYRISLIPQIDMSSVVVEPRDTLKTKVKNEQIYEERSNEMVVRGGIYYVWVNNDNPDEKITIPWFFVGQQGDASQAFGSGLTYSARYFKLQYFNCATTDDPDKILAKKKEVEAAEMKKALTDIITKVGEVIDARLSAKPDDRDKIVEICKQYTIVDGKPIANYKKITDPVMASELLSALNKFVKEEN